MDVILNEMGVPYNLMMVMQISMSAVQYGMVRIQSGIRVVEKSMVAVQN